MYRLRGDGFAGDVVPSGGAASSDVEERLDVDGLDHKVVSEFDRQWKRDRSAAPADSPDGNDPFDYEDGAANEIEIARVEGWWRVVGIDVSAQSLFRRLLPRQLAPRIQPSGFLDWASLEPFTGHIPTIRLRVPHPKLARLHAAELADLVEAAPHGQGEEIVAAVQHDPEREADLFEELADERQLEFAEDRDDGEIADLLARMETDDAADLVAQFDDERRTRLLDLLPPVQRRRLRTLLGYDPLTAGGRAPDFLCRRG